MVGHRGQRPAQIQDDPLPRRVGAPGLDVDHGLLPTAPLHGDVGVALRGAAARFQVVDAFVLRPEGVEPLLGGGADEPGGAIHRLERPALVLQVGERRAEHHVDGRRPLARLHFPALFERKLRGRRLHHRRRMATPGQHERGGQRDYPNTPVHHSLLRAQSLGLVSCRRQASRPAMSFPRVFHATPSRTKKSTKKTSHCALRTIGQGDGTGSPAPPRSARGRTSGGSNDDSDGPGGAPAAAARAKDARGAAPAPRR